MEEKGGKASKSEVKTGKLSFAETKSPNTRDMFSIVNISLGVEGNFQQLQKVICFEKCLAAEWFLLLCFFKVGC